MIACRKVFLCLGLLFSASVLSAEKEELAEVELKPDMLKYDQPVVAGNVVLSERLLPRGRPVRTTIVRALKLILSDDLRAQFKTFADKSMTVDLTGSSTQRGFEVKSVKETAGLPKRPVLSAAERPSISDEELQALMKTPPMQAFNLTDKKGRQFELGKWIKESKIVYVLTQDGHIVETALGLALVRETAFKDEQYTVTVKPETTDANGDLVPAVREMRTRRVFLEPSGAIEKFVEGEEVRRETNLISFKNTYYTIAAPRGTALQVLLKTSPARSFVLKDKDGKEFNLGEWKDESSLTYVLMAQDLPVKTIHAPTREIRIIENKLLLEPESKDAAGNVTPARYDIQRMSATVRASEKPPFFANGENVTQHGRNMNVNGDEYEIVSMLAFTKARLQQIMARKPAESYALKDKSGKEYHFGKYHNGSSDIYVLSDKERPVDMVTVRTSGVTGFKEETYQALVSPAWVGADGTKVPAVYENRMRQVPVMGVLPNVAFSEGENVHLDGGKLIFNNVEYEVMPGAENDAF